MKSNNSFPSASTHVDMRILPGIILFIVLLGGFKPIAVKEETNVALGGYDTVAYFTEGQAVKGHPFYTVTWKDAIWRFSSKINVDLFKADPEKYVPEFGGYCSFGLTNGTVAYCDPEAFIIIDDKLYVMKNKTMLSIWKKDPRRYIEKARKNWLKQLKQSESGKNVEVRQDCDVPEEEKSIKEMGKGQKQ